MSSLQFLKRRMKSIQSTRQITKAMELVAASKMRKAQSQTLQSRPYSAEGFTLIRQLSSRIDRSTHPLLAHREIQTVLLIIVTSDRGLAGAYNTLIFREVIRFIQTHSDRKVHVIAIGKKGADALSKIAEIELLATYTNFPIHPSATDVIPIAKEATQGFTSGRFDSVQIAYTHFHSTVKQEPRVEELLPLQNGNNLSPEPIARTNLSNHFDYTFEPNSDIVFDFILPRVIEVQIYQRILEAIASEHSARMVAMKNATDNATEIIGDLELTYNSARQSKITQELLEISQGFEI